MVSASVKRIVLDENNKNKVKGVELADGKFVKSKTVVSDAGLINTVTKLLPPDNPVNIDFAEDDSTSSGKLHPGASAINLFVGLKGSFRSLNLPHSQYWLYPSHDMSKSVQRLKSLSLDEALKLNPKELTPVFVGNPSAKDRRWDKESPGKCVLEIITLGPQWEWFEKFTDFDKRTRSHGSEYEAVKLRCKFW
jgi:all-trans-retinol 13,14-reductase